MRLTRPLAETLRLDLHSIIQKKKILKLITLLKVAANEQLQVTTVTESKVAVFLSSENSSSDTAAEPRLESHTVRHTHACTSIFRWTEH